eukprot:m.188582 g.188582  ORF g.188582 m.188582 type:complete len:501 (+) comp17487_c0_seq1:41-1543(+)
MLRRTRGLFGAVVAVVLLVTGWPCHVASSSSSQAPPPSPTAGNRPPRAPRFSWDTIPIFIHSSNSSGSVNDDAIALMAKFPLVTIEKFQGTCANSPGVGPQCHQEDAIIDVLKRVRQVNPNATTIFYYNTVLNFKQYAFGGQGFPTPLLLTNSSGDLITMGHGQMELAIYDFGQAAAQAEFLAECVNATRTGWVDGCFADRVMDGSPCCNDGSGNALLGGAKCEDISSPMTTAQCAAYNTGHLDVVNNLTRAISPGPIIANHAFTTDETLYPALHITGSMTESLPQDDSGIAMLQWHAQRGLVIEAHSNDCPPAGPGRVSLLAHFLIGAGRLAYFGCGSWSSSASDWNDRWFDEFERPLGPPVADATKDNATGVWTRSFQSPHGMVNVSWNAATGGTIDWPGYPPPPPPPPPQPTQQCPKIETKCTVVGTGSPCGFPIGSWDECCSICNRHKGTCTAYRWTNTTSKGCALFQGHTTIVPGNGPAGSVCGTPLNLLEKSHE